MLLRNINSSAILTERRPDQPCGAPLRHACWPSLAGVWQRVQASPLQHACQRESARNRLDRPPANAGWDAISYQYATAQHDYPLALGQRQQVFLAAQAICGPIPMTAFTLANNCQHFENASSAVQAASPV